MICNPSETTLGASLCLVKLGLRPIALNFANRVQPSGGFLVGSHSTRRGIGAGRTTSSYTINTQTVAARLQRGRRPRLQSNHTETLDRFHRLFRAYGSDGFCTYGWSQRVGGG